MEGEDEEDRENELLTDSDDNDEGDDRRAVE